jgi:hypothetical protein
MAVGLPGEAKLEASIFFTVFKVDFSIGTMSERALTCGFRASMSKDLTSGLRNS